MTMTSSDLIALAPFVVIGAAAVAVLLLIAFRRRHGLTAFLTAAGIGLALLSAYLIAPHVPRTVTGLLSVDRYALFYTMLILFAALSVCALSYPYLAQLPGRKEEFYVLLLIASLGACVLTASVHLVSFFLGIEVLTVSLYGMIAYVRSSDRGLEAGLKYLMLAAVSSAFILFGMALVYAETGSMDFGGIIGRSAAVHPLLFLTGFGMIMVGVGFKLAAVPFHLWAPDVYEGAPAPVTVFIATVSKVAVFAVLLRFTGVMDLTPGSAVFRILSLIAVLSMVIGNLLALQQTNVKRLLAYSSIAHAGYILVAFLAGGRDGRAAATFYLAAYLLTTLGAFGTVTVLSRKDGDAATSDDYQGLAWRRPGPAAVLTVMLLSLAGMPLTAGFIGKFFVAAAGVNGSLWAPVSALVLGSVIGLFYYLRLISLLFSGPGSVIPLPHAPSVVNGSLLAILVLLVLLVGVYPGPLLNIIGRLFL